MTLPVGTISMSQVNVELLRPATQTISLNDAQVRGLAGVPSGAISMSQLQGKTYSYAFDLLVVAGGGGGGEGGGGAGGFFATSGTFVPGNSYLCLLYTSPSPRDRQKSRMPSSA